MPVPYDNYISQIFVDGRIFFRHTTGLVCVDVRADPITGHKLAPLSSPNWAKDLPEGLRELTSPRLHERALGAQALKGRKVDIDPETVTALLRQGDLNVRRAVRRAGLAPGPGMEDLLLELVNSGDADSAYELARIAGHSDSAMARLIELAESPEASRLIRRAAIVGLAGLGGGADTMVELLDEPALGPVSARALADLGKVEAPVWQALATAANSENSDIAFAAADSLNQLALDDVPVDHCKAAAAQLPEPGSSGWREHGRFSVPWAACALGETGTDWIRAALAHEISSDRYNWKLVKVLGGALLARGVPPTDPIFDRAREIRSLQELLTERGKVPREREEPFAESYLNFWERLDADVDAAGDGSSVW